MSTLFSGPPTPPAPPPPVAMPDLADPAVLAAKQRVIDQAASRSGVASTRLSDSYAGDKLGQA